MKMNESKMLQRKITVSSEKYGVVGEIYDYGVVTKLFFSYQGRKVEIGLNRIWEDTEEAWKSIGQKTIDSYIENLTTEELKTMLFYWNVTTLEDKTLMAHGRVTGHAKLSDSWFIHSSVIKEILLDKENEEVLIKTGNTVYHCPFCYCNFKRQDEEDDLIPEYAWIKEHYQGTAYDPTVEEEQVLLVLSNFDEYFFHSIYYKKKGEDERKDFRGHAHIGTFQDSFLIRVKGTPIDLRYYPHFRNVEFYSQETDGKRFFIENVGNAVLYAKTWSGLFRFLPGERKEIVKENAEKEKPVLPEGDLYPAGILG